MNKLLSIAIFLTCYFSVIIGCGPPCSESFCNSNTPETMCMGGHFGDCDGCGSSNCKLFWISRKICASYGQYFGEDCGCKFQCAPNSGPSLSAPFP